MQARISPIISCMDVTIIPIAAGAAAATYCLMKRAAKQPDQVKWNFIIPSTKKVTKLHQTELRPNQTDYLTYIHLLWWCRRWRRRRFHLFMMMYNLLKDIPRVSKRAMLHTQMNCEFLMSYTRRYTKYWDINETAPMHSPSHMSAGYVYK